jgi:hypothetical protein
VTKRCDWKRLRWKTEARLRLWMVLPVQIIIVGKSEHKRDYRGYAASQTEARMDLYGTTTLAGCKAWDGRRREAL